MMFIMAQAHKATSATTPEEKLDAATAESAAAAAAEPAAHRKLRGDKGESTSGISQVLPSHEDHGGNTENTRSEG